MQLQAYRKKKIVFFKKNIRKEATKELGHKRKRFRRVTRTIAHQKIKIKGRRVTSNPEKTSRW